MSVTIQPDLFSSLRVGEAYSYRFGTHCHPAIQLDTGEKYIVKVYGYSIKQTVTEAFLRLGIFHDEASVLQFYEDMSREKLQDIAIINELSDTDSFTPVLASKQVATGNGSYEVYTVTSYRKTLAHCMQKGLLSHLDGVMLGIDICNAFTRCRRLGWLYGATKPENIYITREGAYQLGEPYFLRLDDLKYLTLPEKYYHPYIPRSCQDCLAQLDDNIDIYALGVILYQVFSGGTIPESFDNPPPYADTPLRQIILKACAPNPDDRWRTPEEMGKALFDYLENQKPQNTPIVPVKPSR